MGQEDISISYVINIILAPVIIYWGPIISLIETGGYRKL